DWPTMVSDFPSPLIMSVTPGGTYVEMSWYRPGASFSSMVTGARCAGRALTAATRAWRVLSVVTLITSGLTPNRIVFGAALVPALAGLLLATDAVSHVIAVRRVPTDRSSADEVTRYDEVASNAPISGAFPALSPAGPRSAPR